MRTDVFGRLLDISVPETVGCSACNGHAERVSSVWQGKEGSYHNYQCRAEGCPAGGTIVEHNSGERHRVGPVFGDPDLAVRLALREQPDAPAESPEVRP